MRARKKKNLAPRLENCSSLSVQTIETDGSRPLYLEIGCGKGAFANAMAQKYDCDYFALEKIPDVIVMAMEKTASLGLTNIRYLIADASDLPEICAPASVDRIFLNFSDPWPKKKGSKKRLTYRDFLEKYKQILKPDGEIHFKTDNVNLFEFSLEEFEFCGFELYDVTRDLHASDIDGHPVTEYEARFSAEGVPINHLKARMPR